MKKNGINYYSDIGRFTVVARVHQHEQAILRKSSQKYGMNTLRLIVERDHLLD